LSGYQLIRELKAPLSYALSQIHITAARNLFRLAAIPQVASPKPDNYSFTQIVFCLQSEIAEQISRDHTKTHAALTDLAIRTSLSSLNVSRPGSRNVTARDGNKVLLAAMAHY